MQLIGDTMNRISKIIITASKKLSKTIAWIYFLAGILNVVFNNSFFGAEGNFILNLIIFAVGYPMTKCLTDIIEKNISDEFDRAVSIMLLWFNSFIFLAAGIYSLTFGEIPDIIGIPMVTLLLISSALFLVRLWKWRWFR